MASPSACNMASEFASAIALLAVAYTVASYCTPNGALGLGSTVAILT